jgi:hypothetical protein
MTTDADRYATLSRATIQSALTVLEDTETSAGVLDSMLTTPWIRDKVWLRELIARHPNLSPAGFVILRNDHAESVIGSLLTNPSLPAPSQHVIAADSGISSYTLKFLATNPNLDPELIPVLLTHESSYVRKEIASLPDLTPEQQMVLAADESHFVRLALANNVTLVDVAGNVLVQDEDDFVRKAMARTRKLSIEQQYVLAQDSNDYVRTELASNSSVFPSVLEYMAVNDANGFVRKAVAHNEKTTAETLMHLATDENSYVAWAAKSNRNRNRHG